MLQTHRQLIAAVLLAVGIASVGVTTGAQSPATDDPEKQAQEALRAAEAQLREAEAKVKLARANYERAMNAQIARQIAQKEAPLRQALGSVEWTVVEIRAAGAGAFTLRLSHLQRLFLNDLLVARDAKVSIDNVLGKVADLKRGMRLGGLRLAADDLVVTGIDAFTPEELKDDYRVKEVDLAKKTLSITRAGKEFVSGLFVGNADIETNDGVLADLKPGMQVSLWFAATGGQLSLQRIQPRK